MNTFLKKASASFLIAGLLLPAGYVSAQSTFNPHYIISDHDLLDYNSMSLQDIQEFLDKQTGILATFVTPDIDGVPKTAAEIIYRATQEYQINPKVLLVKLQKEQSLLTDDDPSERQLDWATGYAICDSCSKDDPRLQKYKGFATQVDYGAGSMRYYYDNPNQFQMQVGQSITIDDEQITPQNQATVNLYIYTPHIHGNQNFWKLWQKWFAKNYPDGTLVQVTGEPGVWLIHNGVRRPITSRTALTSRFDENKIIQITPVDLEKYEIGRPISIPNFSLLRSPSGIIYLLIDDKIRALESDEVMKQIGFSPDEVLDVEWEDIQELKLGAMITASTIHPRGVLLQDESTGGVYWVENSQKHPIWSGVLIKTNFPDKKITPASPEELAAYQLAEPVGFDDGELVKSFDDPTVYVISNGKKRPIASEGAFNSLGYAWDRIVSVESQVLEIHETGEAIK